MSEPLPFDASRYAPRPTPPGPLERAVKPPKPPKRINPINRERRAKVHAATFGPQARACRMLPCCVCARKAPSDPAHVRSRGAGGRDSDAVPMCRAHHSEQHAIGIETFQARHNVILDVIAGELAKALKEHECTAWPVLTDDGEGLSYSCALCQRTISGEEFGK